MRSLHRLALLALPLLGRVVCDEPASPTTDPRPNAIYANAQEAFQDLLNALPESSLHAALNGLNAFKDGVFESDRHGVERVHKENPPLATKLIVAAVEDLKKRQDPPSNGTSTPTPTPEPESSQPPTPESSDEPPPPPPSSRDSAVVVPVPVSTTDSNGQATVISSEILSQPTASIAVPITRTNAQGETVVTTEAKPAVIFTATDAAGSAFVTTSAVDFAPTPGQVLTRTNAEGSTFLTTYTPAGGRVSSVLLITTTDAHGQPSVVTSYTFVDPAATGADGQPPPSGTNAGGPPGLQTNAARRNLGVEAAVVGGAVGGVFALFV